MGAAMSEESTGYDVDEMPYSENPSKAQATEDDGMVASDPPSAAQNLMLIKEGNVAFETSNRDSTYAHVMGQLDQFGAYVSKESMEESGYRKEVWLTLRVPAANFDALLNAIGAGVKEFDERTISVRDVSAQYVDLEARLKAKLELENRYLSLLKQANKVEDILKVEARLNEVRTDIERMEAHRRQLQSQVSVSTLQVRFYEYVADHSHVEDKPNRWLRALENGWSLVVGLMLALVTVWPFVLGGGVLVIFLLRRKRRHSKK